MLKAASYSKSRNARYYHKTNDQSNLRKFDHPILKTFRHHTFTQSAKGNATALYNNITASTHPATLEGTKHIPIGHRQPENKITCKNTTTMHTQISDFHLLHNFIYLQSVQGDESTTSITCMNHYTLPNHNIIALFIDIK